MCLGHREMGAGVNKDKRDDKEQDKGLCPYGNIMNGSKSIKDVEADK